MMGGKSKSLCLSHNLKKYGELSLVMMGGKSKFQLAKWEKICLPKVFGGWGIKSLQWFNHALYLKSLWCGLFGPSLWTEVFLSKYLKKYSMEYWIRKDDKSISQASNIWYGFTRTFP